MPKTFLFAFIIVICLIPGVARADGLQGLDALIFPASIIISAIALPIQLIVLLSLVIRVAVARIFGFLIGTAGIIIGLWELAMDIQVMNEPSTNVAPVVIFAVVAVCISCLISIAILWLAFRKKA